MTRKRTVVPESAWCNMVGLAAFGLYRRMQAMMATGLPYGHLTTIAGTPLTTNDLARLVGETPAIVRKLLDRLVQVQAIEDTGTVFTDPDMIRQGDISVKRSVAGKQGASRTNSRPQAGLFDAANGTDAAPFAAAKVPDAAANGPAHGGHLPGSPAGGKALTEDTIPSVIATPATTSAREAWKPDESGDRLLAMMPSDIHREQLRYLLERVRFAPGWVADMLTKMNPETWQAATPAQMGLAILHFVGNGEVENGKDPSLMYFGAYVNRSIRGTLSAVAPTKFGRALSPGRPTAEYDGTGNTAAADALERGL